MIILYLSIFIIGYIFIASEHKFAINKSASALLAGILMWVVYSYQAEEGITIVNQHLVHSLAEISEILFFLLGAMTIVELIDSHRGFDYITSHIRTRSMGKLLWLLVAMTFVLSAILDNLTTTIVMVSLMRKLITDKKDRLVFASLIVIAANAGGAWSPIGDVTTTMLWIRGQITSWNIIKELFLPSVACALAPSLIVAWRYRGKKVLVELKNETTPQSETEHQKIILALGIGIFITVPIFKFITHLPPYLGMLLGLAVLWITTEIIHSKKENDIRNRLSVMHALRKIDIPSILFFLGILLAVSVLQHVGILTHFATYLGSASNNNTTIIASLLGVLSAIVDNVPLVAATQAMYPLSVYPTDHYFWELLAFTTGTGGSILIIGSAAGVAAMGIEKIDFMWYLKSFSLLALLGFVCGIGVYVLESSIHF